MDFGLGYFPTQFGIDPGEIATLAEGHGFESLFFADHTHIPASRESPYSGGGELPRQYIHTYDLFVAMTAAASATRRLRIGSGVALVVERDPIITAKQIASVDHLSGGRVEFGIGAGWNREEMANHGTNPKTRMRLMRERIEAMKAIWTQDEATYHGEFVNFDRSWCWPKPVQRPHPPILVGGYGPTVEERVLEYGDAWFPHYGRRVAARYRALQERADRRIELQVIGLPADPRILEELASAGARRAAIWIPSGTISVVERAISAWERAIAKFMGEG